MLFVYFICMLVLMAAWVSFPLFPAIQIYRRFPKTPLVVSGPLAAPLANLTINTGGAFAAFLIIFLVVFPLVNRASDAISSATRPYWEIRGEVTLLDETGKEIQALDQVLNKMDVQTRPNILGHDGTTLRFKIPEADDGHLPSVVLSFPQSNWGTKRLVLDEQAPPWWMFWKWGEHTETRDNFHKKIDVGKVTIQLQPPPRTYTSTLGMDPPASGPAVR
jgi:hypothetical protein